MAASPDMKQGQQKDTWNNTPRNTPSFPAMGMSTYYSADRKQPASRDAPTPAASLPRDRKQPGALIYRSSLSGSVDRNSVTSKPSGSSSTVKATNGNVKDQPTVVNSKKTSNGKSHPGNSVEDSGTSSNGTTPTGTPSSGSSHSTLSSCASYNVNDDNGMSQLTSKYRTVVSIASDNDRAKTFSKPNGTAHKTNAENVRSNDATPGEVLVRSASSARPSPASRPAGHEKISENDGQTRIRDDYGTVSCSRNSVSSTVGRDARNNSSVLKTDSPESARPRRPLESAENSFNKVVSRTETTTLMTNAGKQEEQGVGDNTDKPRDLPTVNTDMSTRRLPLSHQPADDPEVIHNGVNQPMYENCIPSPPPPLPPHRTFNNNNNQRADNEGMLPVMVHIGPESNNGYGIGAIDHTLSNGYATNTAYSGFSNQHHTPTSSDISDSLDSEGSSLNQESGYRFHMDQLSDNSDSRLGSSPGSVEHPFLINQRDILNPQEIKETKIVSSKGTVRGLKNLVRAGIATFAEKQDGIKNYRQLEAGKVVVYTTSVMIVRETFDRCLKVKKILHTHMIKFEERDIFMSREHQRELHERLGPHKDVPQIFADGQHIGGLEELEAMNESGELRHLFRPFKRLNRHTSCSNCGGYQYLPCGACHGSKKSQNRNYFTEEFYALRCTNCDENGLVRCDVCTDGEVITS